MVSCLESIPAAILSIPKAATSCGRDSRISVQGPRQPSRPMPSVLPYSRPCTHLESLGFAQNFLSSCELEALHFIGIRSFGEEFREDVVFRGIQEKFRKPLA